AHTILRPTLRSIDRRILLPMPSCRCLPALAAASPGPREAFWAAEKTAAPPVPADVRPVVVLWAIPASIDPAYRQTSSEVQAESMPPWSRMLSVRVHAKLHHRIVANSTCPLSWWSFWNPLIEDITKSLL